jgi:hypothetical protein
MCDVEVSTKNLCQAVCLLKNVNKSKMTLAKFVFQYRDAATTLVQKQRHTAGYHLISLTRHKTLLCKRNIYRSLSASK